MTHEQKYKIIVHFIEGQITSGKYRIGDKIPSANAFKIKFGVSRSSVFLAMDELKARGLVESEPSVGYYVSSDQVKIQEKVFLLFNEVNAFKEMIYQSFLAEIGENAIVDIMFHNYNRSVFETLLKSANGKYTSYILMPGKFKGIDSILSSIEGNIVLADHFDKELTGKYSSVGQDFEGDTYNALCNGLEHIRKYKQILLIQRSEKEPEERYAGICRFCEENGFMHRLIPSIEGREIERGNLYITPEDLELVALIKLMQKQKLTLGKDLGIISYNDTPVKEILAGGITTLSSDFKAMGRTLAHLVKDKEVRTIPNPCTLTIRNSI